MRNDIALLGRIPHSNAAYFYVEAYQLVVKIISSSITVFILTEFLGSLNEFCVYKKDKEVFLNTMRELGEERKTRGGPKRNYDQ